MLQTIVRRHSGLRRNGTGRSGDERRQPERAAVWISSTPPSPPAYHYYRAPSLIQRAPLGLPFNTFDYQVTGLTASQPYVFKLRNLPNANYTNSTLFSSPVGFTPSGGVQEAFGTPGSERSIRPTIGAASSAPAAVGDLLAINTNSANSLTQGNGHSAHRRTPAKRLRTSRARRISAIRSHWRP